MAYLSVPGLLAEADVIGLRLINDRFYFRDVRLKAMIQFATNQLPRSL